METKRWLPLTAIAFVALLILAIVGLSGGSPTSTTPAAEVDAYYEEHSVEQFVAPLVLAAAVPFLALFAVGLAAARPARQTSSPWERLLVGGSLITGAMLLVLALGTFALADGASNDASPGALEALNLLVGSAWVALFPGLGVLMLGAAGTLLAAPRSEWLGWSALVLGIALFFPYANFFAFLLSAAWMVAAGIVVSRQARQPRVAHGAVSLS